MHIIFSSGHVTEAIAGLNILHAIFIEMWKCSLVSVFYPLEQLLLYLFQQTQW